MFNYDVIPVSDSLDDKKHENPRVTSLINHFFVVSFVKLESRMNFLRKLRRDNADGGSVATYLIYGIGEIFLVVIGILIAVSVNNWNEEKKSQKELLNIYIYC